ncbi:hypothetical protein G6F46_015141 [Rhizopus delemar]|nr:hypothetical protein G6F46_015141 [Rhizopus delemar]
MISSTRLSDSRMNSIWRNTWARLGVSTTPAHCVRLDSSAAAALTARVGSAADSISPMLCAPRRGNSAGGRMRAMDQPQLFQVRHHIAERGRGQVEDFR